MTSPLVSIVVPTYNRARLLPETLASALQQTWSRLEVLLVDDGSTDGTRELAAEIAGRDARLRYIPQANGGVSSARNAGLRAAQGEFVAFLDSDDLWKPWKLEVQVACMARFPEAVLTWTDMEAIDADGHVLHPRYLQKMYSAYGFVSRADLFREQTSLADVAAVPQGVDPQAYVGCGDIYPRLIHGNLVHTSTVMARREALLRVGEFRTDFRRAGEDFDFHFRTCAEGPAAFIDVPSIQYRIGLEDQITSGANQLAFAEAYLATIAAAVGNRQRLAVDDRVIGDVFAEAHRWIAEAAFDRGLRGRAAAALVCSLVRRPLRPAAWKLMLKLGLPGPVLQFVRSCRDRLIAPPVQHDRPLAHTLID